MVAENEKRLKWYARKAGSRLIETEKEKLSASLATIYGYHLVFLGEPDLSHLVESSLIPHQIVVNPHALAKEKVSPLVGEMDAIPLAQDSVDLVVLAHTLEQAQNPHEILREAYRILIPEGHIIITGLNPYSVWGCGYGVKKRFSANRIKDWLQLLNFQIIESKSFHFRPPAGDNFYEKLEFLEKWGQHAWPFFAGAYILVAVKRVIPLTPIRKKWKEAKKIWQPVEGVVKPTTNMQEENQETS